ncbi:MAG TPA: hypothetical protein VNE40_01080 [Candidatus Dormibacteraeota bacterium]|nr:hypothetical protein [Candidatus Dormibacteraeota bacterium]
MSNTIVKLQIPLDKSLRDAVDKHARQLGFSSVQDFTRVMYSTVVSDKLKFSLSNNAEHISPVAEARYEKMLAEHVVDKKTGKVKTYTGIDDFLADL